MARGMTELLVAYSSWPILALELHGTGLNLNGRIQQNTNGGLWLAYKYLLIPFARDITSSHTSGEIYINLSLCS